MKGFYARQLSLGGAVLAPMAGYSDAPFRQLATEHGAAWTVSEMMSARGVLDDLARTGRGGGHSTPTLALGQPWPGERERVIQLFGADADVLATASAQVQAFFAPAAIDLNLGCPVPKVRGRGGSCLLQTPQEAYALVRAMREAVDCDVSAKMRLGWDEDRSLEIAQGLAEAGASLITVHGRTAAQRYEGHADWDAIARVAAAVPVPVVGSGDVTTASEAGERRRLGVAGVMIGRGAVGQPWIFREVRGGPPATEAERAAVALRHARLNTEVYGESVGLRQLRKVLPRYFPGRPDWHGALVRLDSLAALEALLGEALEAAD